MTEAVQEKKEKKARAKKKTMRQVTQGNVYIQASYNNTMVTITDLDGKVLGWSSAGVVGFKGPKKATPYAASLVVKDVAEKIASCGVKELNVKVKGIGGGREGAVRALNANGFFVKSIKDVTPIPHNGWRPPKPRRV
ncbi:30S ribosomal protein S11 [Candidatus Uhrbacteria bacterium RIFCSPLOWO2_02_FULL_51_9]|uniref:Small ribosomal subunit protein uS11 n=1 Tax=Candidatus Uhrbacteria bacterium RIFCSPLOWO2_02_FULL_51_9 TaxID=1802410 RepID=A0A1F7VDA1_9BACT|nr:MAG: 30S ribosomal protein S11 [Candidatus Uhrbacteria bacterium RIFCSPLOWO2_02_FULL_51_9]